MASTGVSNGEMDDTNARPLWTPQAPHPPKSTGEHLFDIPCGFVGVASLECTHRCALSQSVHLPMREVSLSSSDEGGRLWCGGNIQIIVKRHFSRICRIGFASRCVQFEQSAQVEGGSNEHFFFSKLSRVR